MEYGQEVDPMNSSLVSEEESYRQTIAVDSATEARKKVGLSLKRKLYQSEQINNAVADIKLGMSARQAALKWHVPRTTLQNRKKGGFQEVLRPGPSTILTIEEETLLCEWLIELCRRGIPNSKGLPARQYTAHSDRRTTPQSIHFESSRKRVVQSFSTST